MIDSQTLSEAEHLLEGYHEHHIIDVLTMDNPAIFRWVVTYWCNPKQETDWRGVKLTVLYRDFNKGGALRAIKTIVVS